MASIDLATEQRLNREMDTASRNRGRVRIWLGVVVLVLVALVLVGGATRLTESGLSITAVEADPRRHPAAHRRRMAGGVRALPEASRNTSSSTAT